MDIRRASPDDAERLLHLINLAFQVEKFFVPGDRIDLAGIRDLFGKGEFLIADGGCVYIEPRADRCYLGLLSVDPARQGTGIGRRLMEAAEARAAELGCAVVLILMSLQMLFVISRKSITCDEIVMIPFGYYHVAAQNFELFNDHPPVSNILAAIPLLFIQPEEVRPEQIPGEPGSIDERWAHMESFWENNPDKFLALSFCSASYNC